LVSLIAQDLERVWEEARSLAESQLEEVGQLVRQFVLQPVTPVATCQFENAVEECLRFDGPIPLTQRIPHEDVVFGEKTIPKDTSVLVLLAAANRDPDHFPDPDRFDITRDPNPHIAFGGGAHLCLGTHLARMESRIAIGHLVERFPKLQLESETVEWGASLFRVPGALPIALA